MSRDPKKRAPDHPGIARRRALLLLAAGVGLMVAGLAVLFSIVLHRDSPGTVASPGPRLEIQQHRVDFGRVLETDIPTATVTVRNVGDAPLVIEKLEAS